MGIGNRIKEQRVKSGLTQREVAEKLFVTTQAVSRWENNETEPSIDTIKALTELFQVSVDTLLGTSEEKEVSFIPKKNLSKTNYRFFLFLYSFFFLLSSVPFVFIGIRYLNILYLSIGSIPMVLCLSIVIFYFRKLFIVSKIKNYQYGRILGVTVYRYYRVIFKGDDKIYKQYLVNFGKYKYITNSLCAYIVDKRGKGYLIDILYEESKDENHKF